LHLCYETPRTLDVRRAALQNPELARELFGHCHVTPQVLEYDERSTLIESLDLDDQAYGRMTISLIDHALPVPLLRYQTGYLVRLLDPSRVMLAMWRRGLQLSGPLPSTLLALAGRKDGGTACADPSHAKPSPWCQAPKPRPRQRLLQLHSQADAEGPAILRNRILQV
jgi:hypothetical protein